MPIVPGINASGEPPSMLRNVLPRPTVSQAEYPDAGYIRVTGPKGCQDCGSQVWNGDVDSRRNLAGINFAALGRGLASTHLRLGNSHGRHVRLGLLPYDQLSPGQRLLVGGLQLASIGVSGYHGYKANGRSIGWGLWWGFCGAVAPVITPVVAVVRGYGRRHR